MPALSAPTLPMLMRFDERLIELVCAPRDYESGAHCRADAGAAQVRHEDVSAERDDAPPRTNI